MKRFCELLLWMLGLLCVCLNASSQINKHYNINIHFERIDSLWDEDCLNEAIAEINITMPLIIRYCGKLSEEYSLLTYNAARIFCENGERKRACTIIDENQW